VTVELEPTLEREIKEA
jgi:hypothetical protein